MIPWTISFYFVFVSRPSVIPKSANTLLSSTQINNQINLVPSKLILTSYTFLVTPSFISSCVDLFKSPMDNPWFENETTVEILDGYLSKLPVIFDIFLPLALIYYHKAFRKKCRELYLHGFRNSVSDGRQISIERLKRSKKNEFLTDDAPVLFLEHAGVINVRYPSEDGFLIKMCDLDQHEINPNGKKAVRFSMRVSRAPNESGVFSTAEPKNKESCL